MVLQDELVRYRIVKKQRFIALLSPKLYSARSQLRIFKSVERLILQWFHVFPFSRIRDRAEYIAVQKIYSAVSFGCVATNQWRSLNDRFTRLTCLSLETCVCLLLAGC
jgi:hypothetical protein